MIVVSTAGHVDHGKSSLVRALTGMEPDRLAEEQRRGLTIDLGYAWTSGTDPDHVIAFVDVPGHERFIATTLAGLGAAATVLLVVAADSGWSAQTAEHLSAIGALGMSHGVVAVTRSDLADPGPVVADVAERLEGGPLTGAPVLPVSSRRGHERGLDDVLRALTRSVVRPVRTGAAAAGPTGVEGAAGPTDPPGTPAPADLWVDRAFSVRGSGTVVTGTLTQGTVRRDQQFHLAGTVGSRAVTARRIQSLGEDRELLVAPARAAVNLRGVPAEAVGRGDRLIGAPTDATTSADVRLVAGRAGVRWASAGWSTAGGPGEDGPPGTQELPGSAMLHVGTAARQVRLRPLDGDHWRLSWESPLPLRAGDHGLLRDPGRRLVLAGVRVLDAAPPPLERRGDAGRRGAELSGSDEVLRRADRLVPAADWEAAHRRLAEATGGGPVPVAEVRRATGLRGRATLEALLAEAGLEVRDGRVVRQAAANLTSDEAAVVEAVRRELLQAPFAAPTRDRLAGAGLGPRVLREAAAAGRVLLLAGEVVLLPDAPRRAIGVLAALEQPFTTSAARQALDSTRRVVLPLLEHLDATGWTRRLEDSRRVVVDDP